jgi:hypothetical protein
MKGSIFKKSMSPTIIYFCALCRMDDAEVVVSWRTQTVDSCFFFDLNVVSNNVHSITALG